MLVHVLNKHGKPLMPCEPRKARILLREGKAKPVKGKTGYFTIQLLYGSSGYKQEIVVGIDTGSKRVPIAAVGNSKVYYAKEKILRTDVKKQLSDRASYRRTRRNRKTRYRKPRFHNRVKTKYVRFAQRLLREPPRCGVNNVPKVWKRVKRKKVKSKKKGMFASLSSLLRKLPMVGQNYVVSVKVKKDKRFTKPKVASLRSNLPREAITALTSLGHLY